MSSCLYAEYDAMTRVAADQRRARNELIRVQQQRCEAGLDVGALGKILPAHELVAAFRNVNRATRAGIWGVAQHCEDLSDGVREVRNLYREVDEAVAERFEALLGLSR